jgi:hypothetical protein
MVASRPAKSDDGHVVGQLHSLDWRLLSVRGHLAHLLACGWPKSFAKNIEHGINHQSFLFRR